MSDNETSREDRQLAPSERKLQKAREEGQIPRSRDLGHALVLGTAALGFNGFGAAIGESLLGMVRSGLSFSRAQAIDPAFLTAWFSSLATVALWVIVPSAAVLGFAGAASSLVGGMPSVTTKPLAPDFNRVNPVSGLTRIFSRDNLVDLLKLLGMAIALGSIAVWYATEHLAEFSALSNAPLQASLEVARSGLAGGVGLLIVLLFLAATLDVPLQWYRHYSRLRMTHQEVRDESREAEGDPQIRARVRQRQREIASRRMLAAVPTADVVVTNPTHYAVALRYDENGTGAPRVVAKGTDLIAARIREIAREAGVPLFEAPPLARALHAHVDLDREIPPTLYSAVAQVLAYIFQLRHHVPGRSQAPKAPQDLAVPVGMDPKEASE